MTTAELVEALVAVARELPDGQSDVHWYLFGSSVRDASAAGDFDLAIVCAPERAPAIRKHLAHLCAIWPLHLTILTPAEDASLRFTEAQGMVHLYSNRATVESEQQE